MKRVLVLGATGGVGSACIRLYSDNPSAYEVFGVARRTGTSASNVKAIAGDICIPSFRATLLDLKPQIVIAAYGAFPKSSSSMSATINEFATSTIDLYDRLEADGDLEDFVVLSSLSANLTSLPHAFQPEANHQYIVAKRMLSDYFKQKMMRMNSRSKITLIEPGFIKTGFANIAERAETRPQDDIITRSNIELIDPSAIAKMIFDSTSDAKRFSTCMTVFNLERR